jgi:hypothetical protein
MANENNSKNGVLAPNMFVENADVRQTTWHRTVFNGSVVADSSIGSCQLLDVNMRDNTFARVSLDNSYLTHCSMRNVVIEATDVTGLVINGVRIGDLFQGSPTSKS